MATTTMVPLGSWRRAMLRALRRLFSSGSAPPIAPMMAQITAAQTSTRRRPLRGVPATVSDPLLNLQMRIACGDGTAMVNNVEVSSPRAAARGEGDDAQVGAGVGLLR